MKFGAFTDFIESIPYDKSDGHIWLSGASELISKVGPSRQFTVDGDHHGYPGMTPRQKYLPQDVHPSRSPMVEV